MRSTAAYRIAANVGHVHDTGRSYVALLPEGPPMVLTDSAGVIWAEALAGGTVSAIAGRVADVVGVPVGDIIEDVEAFLDDLVTHGVLVRVEV